MGMAMAGRRRGLLAMGGLGWLAACGGPPEVLQVTYEGPAPMEPPDMVLVHNFATRPQDVELDTALRSQLAAAFVTTNPNPAQLHAAEQASSALSQVIAAGLYDIGRPVQRVPTVTAPGIGRYVMVDGQMLGVDLGDQRQRHLPGLAPGASGVEIAAQVWYLQGGQPPRLLQSFRGTASSAAFPGLGRGGAPGPLGQVAAAARGSTFQEGGLSGGRADIAAEGRAIGTAISMQIRRYMQRQNWVIVR